MYVKKTAKMTFKEKMREFNLDEIDAWTRHLLSLPVNEKFLSFFGSACFKNKLNLTLP